MRLVEQAGVMAVVGGGQMSMEAGGRDEVGEVAGTQL
jgi:hypothetical protein